MTDFIEISFLTAYPASCLVRDEAGRPKTVQVGGTQRGRISSAAMKRAIRVSETFEQKFTGGLGIRTKLVGDRLVESLVEEGVEKEKAVEAARRIAEVFGKVELQNEKNGMDTAATKQLVFIAPEEFETAMSLARRLASGEEVEQKELDGILRESVRAVDIGLFGRMFADRGELKMTAAVSLMHPTTVHKISVESDYFVAVDDWKRASEDLGGGFLGQQGYFSGVFYGYASIDRDQLLRNLGGDQDLCDRGIDAFIRALAVTAPGGKQATFGSKARASFMLIERSEAPRSYWQAFVKPVSGETILEDSAKRILALSEEFSRAYGDSPKARAAMNLTEKVGSLDEIVAVAKG